ncbi:MAG: hypothetical protein IPH45_11430 [Bacteroidales bacterium]|nr:hypothetical protein [Bacteroidales bacterium]
MFIDGHEVTRKALMISFANSDQFGFHSKIAPQAKIDDGFIDICVVTKPSILKVVFSAPRVFFGTFGKTGYAEYFKAKEVTITNTAGSKVNLDGEAFQIDEDVQININPLSLKMIVR